MPFQFDEATLNESSDPDLLDSFFDQLQEFFDQAVDGRIGEVGIRAELGDELPVLLALRADLLEREAYVRAKRAVLESRDGLADVGLSGAALRAKLGTLHRLSNPFRAGVREGIRTALRYLLSILNSILGSLAKALGAIGGAVVHGMKELKEFIEAKLDAAAGL